MKVKRLDLFDFEIVLNQQEFERLKRIAERGKTGMMQALIRIFLAGLDVIEKSKE